MRIRRFPATACLLCVLWPAVVWAHAGLVKSAPGRQATLASAPARVQLWFNERLEGHFCTLSVWNQEGKQVDQGDVEVTTADPKQVSVGLPPLAPGTYRVKYRVLSVDSHIVESEFSFTIRGSR